MQEKKYGHEESKSEKADDLDPAHRQLIDDATPSSDLEHGHMELVMNKMRARRWAWRTSSGGRRSRSSRR